MNAAELLVELRARGVVIEASGDRLKVDAPKGIVTPELREALADRFRREFLSAIRPGYQQRGAGANLHNAGPP